MNKKIYLLLMFILTFFVFCGNVGAAKDLSCIYGKGNHKYMLVQGADDTFELFQSESQEVKWVEFDYDYELNSTDRNILSSNNSFESCPPYLFVTIPQGASAYGSTYYFNFSNVDEGYDLMYHNRYVFIEQSDEKFEVPIDNNIFYFNYNSRYSEEVEKLKKNNGWSAICSYGSMVLYFNDDRYILINDNSNCHMSSLEFSIDDLNNNFRDLLYNCPTRLFVDENELAAGSDANGKKSCAVYLYKENNGKEYTNSYNKVFVFEPDTGNDNSADIESCKDLFGPDLVDKINDIMDIVKIVIPILLIVYGIIDFTKAVFSGKSDDMAKNQKTFFKRILAAILVFIAPIFINLLLTLANEVWDNVGPDNCISEIE